MTTATSTITARRLSIPVSVTGQARENLEAKADRQAERHEKFFVSDLAELAKEIANERAFGARESGMDKELSDKRLAELEKHARAPRGDAAVQATKSARELVALADATGLVVSIDHSSASGGAPYFTVEAIDPVRMVGFRATFHTFIGKNGSYGFRFGSVYRDGRTRYNATIKAMRENITSS